MPAMDLQKIIQDLNRRFSQPLPEFYKRRVIFWKDEDKEFEDKICDVELANAKVFVLTGSNNFIAKKLLCVDDTVSNYLVYSPVSFKNDDDNWLLNVELYSEQFRADLNSIWMDEMGLLADSNFRTVVKRYNKFFNNTERRKAVATLSPFIKTSVHLHLAIMAVICKIKSTKPSAIIRAVLSCSLDNSANAFYQEMEKYGVSDAFWTIAQKFTGYSEENRDLGRLAAHILLTAATRTLRDDRLTGLSEYVSLVHQPYCCDVVSEFVNYDEDSLFDIARFVEEELMLSRRFMNLTLDELMNIEHFPCVNECILKKLMTDICDQIIDVQKLVSVVEKRRSMVWYNMVDCYFEGLMQIANMHSFFVGNNEGFHLSSASEIWKAYTKEYYKMDTYYRLFNKCLTRSLSVSNYVVDDLFKSVADKVEALYNGWFLSGLAQNWTNVCSDELERFGYLPDIERQTMFYKTKVANSNNKVYVIISDALRYEVAQSLTEQLLRETQCKAELSSMQAVFPTITKFGMAALLPHNKLSVTTSGSDKLLVCADSMSTDSNNREKVLKCANENSAVLRYNSIISMKRSDRQELVKGKEIVYIYHDRIDEVSHSSENDVFLACDDAIDEIKNIVRIICNDFGGTNIYITADHGFLYTNKPLNEDDKVSKASFNGMDVEYGRRYAIMQKGAAPDYLLPVKFIDEDSGFDAFAPRENIRIKMSGGGMNFVHGGISLQEMVVPVIEYKYLRNAYKSYQKDKDKIDTKPVKLSLLSATRKITNLIFAMNFYQEEAVSDNRSQCNYLLYFVDSLGAQVSDTVRIIADKTSPNSNERTFRCNFNLKNMKYENTALYYLVIADESGMQEAVKEEFQIDIAFALDDFDFGLFDEEGF